MRMVRILRIGNLALLTIICLSSAAALSAAPCAIGLYSAYTAPGFTCELGGATFSDFSFTSNTTIAPMASDFTVTPIVNPGQIGLRIDGPLTVFGQDPPGTGMGSVALGQLVSNARFLYTVTGETVDFTGATLNVFGGDFFEPNPLSPSGYFAIKLIPVAPGFFLEVEDDTAQSDSVAFPTPLSLLFIDDTTQVIGGGPLAPGGVKGFGTIGGIENLFDIEEVAVPEPATWTLAAAGLALLAWVRRRR